MIGISVPGYEPTWAGQVDAQLSPNVLHALITPPELLHMTQKPARIGWRSRGSLGCDRKLYIYGSANILLKEYGDEALDEARGRLGEFRAIGHLEAAAVWVRIIEAMEAMTAGPIGRVSRQ